MQSQPQVHVVDELALRALEAAETFFWDFTDDYVELVKERAYGAQGEQAQRSALMTLGVALDTLLRLFAPFLPFVTEEVWSWWRPGSVHTATWPQADAIRALAADGDPGLLGTAASVLSAVRKTKSEAKVSMRHRVQIATVRGPANEIARVEAARGDLLAAGSIGLLELSAAEASVEVTVELEPAADN